MRVAIIEDESSAASALEKMLSILEPDFEICAKLAGIFESVLFFKNSDVQIVFLDVQLADGDCFELLSKIPNINFSIIFITAYDNYAIRALKFNAVDYILKPIDPEELVQAISKAKDKLKNQERVKHFLDNRSKVKPRLALKFSSETVYVDIEDIIRLEADCSYTKFVLKNKFLIISKNIKYYEELLNEYNFIRIHQSHLVAADKIVSKTKDFVTMANGDEVPVSVRKRFLFKN